MNKLIWTISIFLLWSTGTFANNIFDNYPWLTGLVQQDNCSTEKVEIYQTGIFTYLLVTDANGIATLYNETGLFYCQNASNFDCVALYNLEGPIDSWDCDSNISITCLVTITNTLCRFIGVYDENDNLLTEMTVGPPLNGPTGQMASVWEDPRPLGMDENRAYIFKERELVIGRQTTSCANPQIESVSNYPDGCTDVVLVAQLTNTGCRTITAYNNTLNILEGTYEPSAEFVLLTGPFIHILTAGTDTLAIISDNDSDTQIAINSGGCEGGGSDNCSVTITNTQCRGIGVYDENDNLLITMNNGPQPNGPPGQLAPLWEDPRPLDETESRTYIFKENNFVLGHRTVSCANPQIEVVSDYFSGCTDAIGLAELVNAGCRTVTVYNTNSEVIGTYAPGVEFVVPTGPFIHIVLADTDTLAIITLDNENRLISLDSGGCVTEECGENSGEIVVTQCDDGTDFFFIKSATDGLLYDAYYVEGINLVKYNGQQVNFNFVLADFDSPCSIADDAIIVTCIEEKTATSETPPIFDQFEWLTSLVDLVNCDVETSITVYQQSIFNFILVQKNGIGRLYFQDGTFYCQNAPDYDCVAAYNLGSPIDFWSCSGAGLAEFLESRNGIESSNNLKFFPNPVTTNLSIQIPAATTEENQQLKIFDAFGRIVLERTVTSSANTSEIEVTNFQNGLYYLVLFTDGKEQIQKFIKQDLK